MKVLFRRPYGIKCNTLPNSGNTGNSCMKFFKENRLTDSEVDKSCDRTKKVKTFFCCKLKFAHSTMQKPYLVLPSTIIFQQTIRTGFLSAVRPHTNKNRNKSSRKSFNFQGKVYLHSNRYACAGSRTLRYQRNKVLNILVYILSSNK